MGGYFQVTDDRTSQRVILRRVNEPGAGVIWLDTDPSGSGVAVIDTPACLSKIDLGSAKLGAAYAIPYKSGVAITLSTDLQATSTATIGGDASWSVVAAGGHAPYSYQWYFNGALINPLINPSAATATLTIHGITAANSGDYYCVVAGADGAQVASTVSRFTATAAPAALKWKTNLPATKSIATGAASNLQVEIEGGQSPYTFVWTKDGNTATGVTNGSKAQVNIASATANDAGKYQVTVTDANSKTLTSAECTVTVTTT